MVSVDQAGDGQYQFQAETLFFCADLWGSLEHVHFGSEGLNFGKCCLDRSWSEI